MTKLTALEEKRVRELADLNETWPASLDVRLRGDTIRVVARRMDAPGQEHVVATMRNNMHKEVL